MLLLPFQITLTSDTSSNSAIKFTARSRTANEPTSSNKDQWINVLWARLGRVVEDVANCCIKVYTLEKVLRMKRDAVTHVEFLEEVMKVRQTSTRPGTGPLIGRRSTRSQALPSGRHWPKHSRRRLSKQHKVSHQPSARRNLILRLDLASASVELRLSQTAASIP